MDIIQWPQFFTARRARVELYQSFGDDFLTAAASRTFFAKI
jgi:hypothetical protein